jgi:hypothetical protein
MRINEWFHRSKTIDTHKREFNILYMATVYLIIYEEDNEHIECHQEMFDR